MFGDEGITLINCETDETKKSTVRGYFEAFLNPTRESGIWKLKVAYQVFLLLWTLSSIFHRIDLLKKTSGTHFQNYLMPLQDAFLVQILLV